MADIYKLFLEYSIINDNYDDFINTLSRTQRRLLKKNKITIEDLINQKLN